MSLYRSLKKQESKMSSYKKVIVNIVVFCSAFGTAGLLAQTQSADLKSPEAADSAKAADTTKAVDTTKPADTAKPADTKLPEVVPAEYIVGESDVLRVTVWKEPDVSQTVVVRTDGNISLPLINDVKVAGMTPLQIQNMIAEKLKGFLNNPQVTVTVTDIRSKRAFITGEVIRPGGYSLNSETSVLQLIAQAGGFTPFAKRDSIVVLRVEDGKPVKLKFKYKEVVQGKNTEQNIALHPGDTVVVP
ncbi:MAG TPA: polysaccharide biosynthesis/export family protein [Candidatus Angelobacter sp.]|nr:polysaccharide biosynthesis/export family protein [Candidatus Angelobacter sp.]